MKTLLRIFVIETVGLYAASQVASGLGFAKGLESLIIAGAALAIAAKLIKPIINLFLLPLTIATLGLFKFITNAITLYIVDLALPQFSVEGFNFPGLVSPYLDLPPIVFESGPLAYLAFSLVVAIITAIVNWIIK